MQTRFRKINSLCQVGRLVLICSGTVFVQTTFGAVPDASSVATSASSTTASPAGTQDSSQTTDKSGLSNAQNSTSSALDYMFNRKPKQGTIAKEGMVANEQAKAEALAQDALGNHIIGDSDIRAQFDAYLAMTEVSQDQLKAYATNVESVFDLLHQKKTAQAWQQLYQLAKYRTIDGGVSWELANRIESMWNVNQTQSQIAQENDQLQKRSDTDNRNADMDAEDIKSKQIDYQRRLKEANGPDNKSSQSQKSGQTQAPNGGAPQMPQADNSQSPITASISDQILGKLQLTREYIDSLEAQGKIKLNELKAEKLFDQAKQDFADYITTLFKTGRYQHVLMAANFWRQIFDQGDYPVAMAEQVNASLEVTQRVNRSIGIFNNNLDQNNIAAATDNLEQAFIMDEFNPAVLGLPVSKKRSILAFTKDLDRVHSMIVARDFSDLASILKDIKNLAPDFDAIKAKAIVDGVELESQLNLGKAKLAAQQGDLKTAMENFQAAAEAWPGNPDLKDKASIFFKSEDLQNQSLTEFDRLVGEGNYRAIYDKQLAFAPAMKDDAKRQEQLKAALEKVRIAETAAEKATLMKSNGDVDGAWEVVELAIKNLPDDVKLNSLRADLAAKGADFVSSISKAQDAETKQELGYSLSWYAIAQRSYPASQIANEAIARISKTILAKSGS